MSNPTNPKASKKLKLNAEKISAVKAGAEVRDATGTPTPEERKNYPGGVKSWIWNNSLNIGCGNKCVKI